MSLPKPYTNEEKFLNRIATGEGELPTPYTNAEILLEYIARNLSTGGDGAADHSHANKTILDKITKEHLDKIEMIGISYIDVEG